MDLARMNWVAVDALDRQTPVVIPIAALEQHGWHMPVFTDSLLLEEVLRRVKQMPVAEKALFVPLQWLGNSHHHVDMPGTVSASPRAYLDMLCDLAENFLRHGFGRIVFVNGHGGNKVPAQQVVFELRQKYRERDDLLLLGITYWDAADPSQTISGLRQNQMGHACEWETSMILRLDPSLVSGELAKVPDVPFGVGGGPGHRGWVMGDRSERGHIGSPAVASVEKGEALFASFAAGVAKYLERAVAWKGGSWDI